MLFSYNNTMKLMKFSSKLMHKASCHVWHFCQDFKLLNKSGNYLLALSGGVDSIFLLNLFVFYRNTNKINSLRCIHINHQTREGQKQEEHFVTDLCKQFNVELIVKKLEFKNQKNFELNARNQRYELFQENLKDDEKLILGHHIDDSFEWSLMQSFRSSNLKKSIGIPVRNGKIIRPLMCLTKSQIYKIAKFENIAWKEDPTNQEVDYERNYVRKMIIPNIARKYPKYLKHYVYRSLQKIKSIKSNEHSILMKKSKNGIRLIYSDIKSLSRELVKSLIFEISTKNRGTIEKQLDKLFEAIRNNKNGPITFSGGVQIYLDYKYLLITNNELLTARSITFGEYKKMDYQSFRNIITKQFKDGLFEGPPVVRLKKERFFGKDLVSKKEIRHFWKFETDETCVYESAMRLLEKWSTKKSLQNKSLKLSLISEIDS